MNKILILAAHPDDEILGCGGLMAKYLEKNVEFRVVFIGEGSSCRFDLSQIVEIDKAIQNRNKSAINAMDNIGIRDFKFFDLPCGRFDTIPIIEINKIIESEIREFKPEAIFTHSKKDVNKDHRLVHESTIMATRPWTSNFIPSVYSYEVPSSSEWNFEDSFWPNYFIEINELQLEKKIHAFSMYKDEMRNYPFPRSKEGLKTMAMYRGIQSGFKYAEAFTLIRGLIK